MEPKRTLSREQTEKVELAAEKATSVIVDLSDGDAHVACAAAVLTLSDLTNRSLRHETEDGVDSVATDTALLIRSLIRSMRGMPFKDASIVMF